jgi:REP element-mobilizing transposase RayT
MQSFCDTLLAVFKGRSALIHAWCVLPNHYHAIIETSDILGVLNDLGRMHGRLSFCWNGKENTRGRQVWCGAAERYMRNDAHFWATLNYVHNNPVHHGYASAGRIGRFRVLPNIWRRWDERLRKRPGVNIQFWIMGKGGMMRNCEKGHAKAWTPNVGCLFGVHPSGCS